jgi:hypothetical protein
VALTSVLELDGSDIRLIAERYASNGAGVGAGAGGGGSTITVNTEVVAMVGARRRQFVAFQTAEVEEAVLKVCRLLGCYGDIAILSDHFLALFRQQRGSQRKQAGIILGELLRGASGYKMAASAEVTVLDGVHAHVHENQHRQHLNSSHSIIAVAEVVVEEFLADELLRLPTCHQEAPESPTTVAVLTHNAQLVTVVLEGVGAVADALREQFGELLLLVMYPLLQKLGSVTAVVAHASLSSMERIARAIGEESVGSLICNSSDYVINAITMNLRYLDLNPHAPMVLRTMLQYSDDRILPLISDSLGEVYEILDGSHDDQVPIFLGILHALVASMERWDTTEGGTKQAKAANGSAGDDDEGGEGDGGGGGSGELPPPLCMEHQIVSDILARCPHYLGHVYATCRLTALEIVGRCGNLLKGMDDVLLPAIHATWPALASRLMDKEAPVQLAAIRVVAQLAEVSGTFMKLRVTTDAIPLLVKLLRGEYSKATDSAVAARTVGTAATADGAGKHQRFARVFKLELGALIGLRRLTAALRIGDDGSEGLGTTVSAAAAIYLHAKQPVELQEQAALLFETLAVDDPDAVWFQLLQLHPPHVPAGHPDPFTPPHPDFARPALPPANVEYATNVDALRKLIAV